MLFSLVTPCLNFRKHIDALLAAGDPGRLCLENVKARTFNVETRRPWREDLNTGFLYVVGFFSAALR